LADAAPAPPAAPADRWRALAVLVAGAMVIALAPILVRLADAGPAAIGFWRLTFALPLLAALGARNRGRATFAPPSRPMLLAGVMFALDLGFWHYGIIYTSVANATVLSNLTPVVVTAFAWIFLKQQPRRLFLVAVALAVAGAWTMAAAKGGAPGRSPLLGDSLSLLTALWYALYMLSIGEARRRDGATRIMFWSSLAGAPLLLIAALALREPLTPAHPGGWLALIGLGLVHVAGQGAIAWALGRLPTATASVVVLVQPVVAAGLGWVLFAEAMGPWQMLGAAIALTGIVLAQKAARPKAAVTL
jgi:drug/metabolite transporter (DMT)-like permease